MPLARRTPDVRCHIGSICPGWLGVANTITNTLAEHAAYYATLRACIVQSEISSSFKRARYSNNNTIRERYLKLHGYLMAYFNSLSSNWLENKVKRIKISSSW